MPKADFDHIYTASDPRQYYEALGSHDYQIPAHAAHVFEQLAHSCSNGSTPRIVDLCCSYGINESVLRHDLSFAQVMEHYRDEALDEFDTEQMKSIDKEFFGSNRRDEPIHVTGVDSSAEAIEYAVETGLLDEGYAVDLETCEPSEALAGAIAAADLVVVSGGIGYITERTIGRVLDQMTTPRLAALSLRWVDFAPIVDAAAERGLVTERLDDATFPQRKFATDDERAHVESELDEFGIDPEGREADGYHHTDLWFLRRPEEAAEQPLDQLLDVGDDAVLLDGDPGETEVSVFEQGTDLR